MVNCDENGIRYGVISTHSLDNDVIDTLWYGNQARDLSYEGAIEELKAEIEWDAENIEEEVRIGVAERDYALLASDSLMEKEVEAAYERLGYSDREDYCTTRLEREAENIQIEEPTIAGTYQDVQYRISWLGGAPLLWVFYSPFTGHFRQCSPCVPNAADCDNPHTDGVLGYDVPPDWRQADE